MSTVQAFLDRFEGQKAVLLIGDDEKQLIIDRNLMPNDAAEGSVVDISITVNKTATEKARKRVQDLINELSGEDA